jgi:hypothetical protein
MSEFNAFADALKGPRAQEAAAFYQEHGIAHESWHLQETPHGPWVIVVSVIRDPAVTGPKYAIATDQFASWFKAQVLTLSGVDPSRNPLGPPTTEVFHWSANAEMAKAIACA